LKLSTKVPIQCGPQPILACQQIRVFVYEEAMKEHLQEVLGYTDLAALGNVRKTSKANI